MFSCLRVFLPFPILGLALTLIGPHSLSAPPRIVWLHSHVAQTLTPGESITLAMSFAVTVPVTQIRLKPVQALASFVSIQPSQFTDIPAGQPQEVTLTLTAPANAVPGVVDGTIHVRSGRRTFPEVLKVSLTFLAPPDGDGGPSPALVTLAGTSETSFNMTGADVRFEITGGLFGQAMALFLNGQPIPSEQLVINPEAVTAPALLVEGRNDLTLIGQDSDGLAIYEDFTLWAGSHALLGSLLDEYGFPATGAVLTARLGDDQRVAAMVGSEAGQFTFMNLPGRTIIIEALASDNRLASIATNGAEGFVQLRLSAIGTPSPIQNNDFSLGTQGWNIGLAPVQIVPHVEGTDIASIGQMPLLQASDFDLVLNTWGEGPQTISRTVQIGPGTQNLVVRYRFITSEVPGGYFGTEFNDYFNVSIRSHVSSGVISESNSMNGLGLAAFDANGATAWRETALAVPTDGDIVQVDLTVANVADELFDSQLVVDFVAEKTLTISVLALRDIDNTPLTHLSADVHPYFEGNTLIHGIVTVEGPEDDGLASLVLEVIQGGVVVAVTNLTPGAQTALLQPFGQAGRVAITASQLVFALPAIQAAAINGTVDGTLTLRARARSTMGEVVTRDAGVVQLLVMYDGTNRYGVRDPAVGGDEWTRPSLQGLVQSYAALAWNDFSNMNGGPFPPHGSHTTGIDVDGLFGGYAALDAVTAQTIIGHLNASAGTQIMFVFVAFQQSDSDPFWAAIRDVTLVDGRQARDVIRPDQGHADHFHWRISTGE